MTIKMRINESSTSCDELDIAEALNLFRTLFLTYFVSIFTTYDRTHIPNLQEKKYKRDIVMDGLCVDTSMTMDE